MSVGHLDNTAKESMAWDPAVLDNVGKLCTSGRRGQVGDGVDDCTGCM